MLLDDLKESLKQLTPTIQAIKDFWNNANLEKQYLELSSQSMQEDFWQQPNQTEVLQKLQQIKIKRDALTSLLEQYNYYNELLEESLSETDIKDLSSNIYTLIKEAKTLKIHLLLNKDHDNNACFLTINAGAGGTESQDWANMLLRMYLRFCEQNKLNAKILDSQQGDEAGIKSASLYIKGDNAHGLLKTEHGVHRLVRISPFDSSQRRHTSFAGVEVTPELPDVKVEIKDEDIRIDTYRAGGAGGQHVNKTDSAVRITHFPTGVVVQCQNERSQTQNKETAMKMLKARIIEKQEKEKREKAASQVKQKIEWGSQIRSYVLHPYKMVKDHRTNTEHIQPELVLDGQIIDFIEAELIRAGSSI